MSARFCGKVAYKSRGRAEQALATIKRESTKHEHRPQRAYPCPDCKHWHLTSMESY